MKISFFLRKNLNFVLILILIFASFLRIYNLNTNPPSLTPDETALGYNAYSIIKTGRDEHGRFLPIIIESFGDYKPALYVYFAIPFIFTLGLNEWSVRLPSAIAGVIAVYLIYKILDKFIFVLKIPKTSFNSTNFYLWVPVTASFLLALNPWHISFSRGAWEANLSLTLTLLGIFLFLKGVENKKYLIFSSICLALTLITYQGAKLSSLIVIFVLAFIFYKELLKNFAKNSKYFLISFLVGFVIAYPILISFTGGEVGRLEVFSVFSYPRPEEYIQQFLKKAGEQKYDWQYYFFHSEALNFARGIAGRLFNHLSARFLFFEGDWQNPRHLPPNQGAFLFADILLITLGFFALIKNGNLKLTIFVILWLVLAPLPAILSRDQVQAVRALNMIIPLVIISSLGLSYFIELLLMISNSFHRGFAFSIFIIFYLVSFIYFVDMYFVHQPVQNAKYWNFGYKQAILSLKPYFGTENKIIFQQSYNQPYIYYLFYTSYDPKKLQEQKLQRYKENKHDVSLVKSIDNIYFENFSWPKLADKGTIIVGDELKVPNDFYKWEEYELVEKIVNPKGSTALTVVKVK